MSLSVWFSRLPHRLANVVYPIVRFTSLMRALELRLLQPWVHSVEGRSVLDVGSGHGFYSLDPARRGARQVSCDVERSDLESAQQIAESLGVDGQTLFVVGNGQALPLADATFDLVVCNCVLEHIADDQAALEAMARSLRPGGILFLTVDNAQHSQALGALERLPDRWKTRLLWPEVASAPTVAEGLDARLDSLYHVVRRYRLDDLSSRLTEMSLTVLDSQSYLSGVGAAHYEAFHAFRCLDPAKGLGRGLWMLSSLILYPLAAWSDSRRTATGHGLALVARKEASPETG